VFKVFTALVVNRATNAADDDVKAQFLTPFFDPLCITKIAKAIAVCNADS
jgi:hypothetical protein